MKIIKVFDHEKISDCLIAEKVPSYYAEYIAKDLNKRFSGDNSPDYFLAVEDHHKLYVFEP